ncbi:MAG TPA: hypothetical protein VEA92_03695 [Candidatus Paceibacterota bacterium]|nr:hypothetical protein [Candidatus Paceibacterota bacterium]
MADIINNPGDNRGGIGGLIAAILGIVLLILLALLFFPNLFGRETDTAGTETQVENTDTDTGSVVIPPPTVNNTTINSTSTINLGTSTDDTDATE